VEPDSTAGFTQRALVKMKETAKARLSKNKNEPSPARSLDVSLDRADSVIKGGTPFPAETENQSIHNQQSRDINNTILIGGDECH
jgi:hypothetical protein